MVLGTALTRIIRRNHRDEARDRRLRALAGAAAPAAAGDRGVRVRVSVPLRQRHREPALLPKGSEFHGGVGLNLKRPIRSTWTSPGIRPGWSSASRALAHAPAGHGHQRRERVDHRFALQDAKRALADGVLDRRGNLAEIRMPTSRAAFWSACRRCRARPATMSRSPPPTLLRVARSTVARRSADPPRRRVAADPGRHPPAAEAATMDHLGP